MEEEDPPPPLCAPPPLPDELVEEILLRSPSDDPTRLVRAALVCKPWCCLISAREFRCRFRDFHLRRWAAPMLGFFHNHLDPNGSLYTRFVRTSVSCPPLHAQRGWIVFVACGGRVLLHRVEELYTCGMLLYSHGVDAASPGICLAVWDPLSAIADHDHLELPVPLLPRHTSSWNATLLCYDQHFRVVLVGSGLRDRTFVYVYSSEGHAAWSEPAYAAQQNFGTSFFYADAMCGALIGNTLYFLFVSRTRILKYDLATADMSVIRLPPPSLGRTMWGTMTLLTTTEDGSLGFARVEGNKLCLRSMEAMPNGGAQAMEWIQRRVIDLSIIDLLGFAEGLGMILVRTVHGIFSVDQKSGRIDKLVDDTNFVNVVPYVSFCTLALGMASTTDEGPSENA